MERRRQLAEQLLRQARAAGADAADVILGEGTDFSVTVRKGEVETLEEAGSKALGLRVFVGKRTANSYTSDFSPPALAELVRETVEMARVISASSPSLPINTSSAAAVVPAGECSPRVAAGSGERCSP